MEMKTPLIIGLTVGLLVPTANAQDSALSKIPAELPETTRAEFAAVRLPLSKRRDDYDKRAGEFNARCGGGIPPSDRPRIAACSREQAALDEAFDMLVTQGRDFNRLLASAVSVWSSSLALQQLRQATAASNEAAGAPAPQAKPSSARCFDTPKGCPGTTETAVPESPTAVAIPDLLKRAPRGLREDPAFRTRTTEWDLLEKQKKALNDCLTSLRTEHSKPGVDKPRLMVLESNYKEALNRTDYEQLIVAKKIRFAVDVAEADERVKKSPADPPTSKPPTPKAP